MAKKPSQRSLENWTRQDWQYSSDKEGKKPRKKRGRYLPKAAWAALSPGEKRATNAAKRKGPRRVSNSLNNLKKLLRRLGPIGKELVDELDY